jgi:DNA-binding HxlR family transcriptional regulator
MPRDEYCPIYRSLDLFGARWGLLVMREILRGVAPFNELERSLPGISRSTLARRLRHLEKEAIVERHTTANGRGTEYAPTEAGRELVNVIMGRPVVDPGCSALRGRRGWFDAMDQPTRHAARTPRPPRGDSIRAARPWPTLLLARVTNW